jgi:transposase
LRWCSDVFEITYWNGGIVRWPAAGSEDTEFGVMMELEVWHGSRRYTREFKVEAVKLVKERGVAVKQAARDPNLHPNVLHRWMKDFAADPQYGFPGKGQMKPEQLEIERLRREVQKFKAERDVLKRAAAYFAKEST